MNEDQLLRIVDAKPRNEADWERVTGPLLERIKLGACTKKLLATWAQRNGVKDLDEQLSWLELRDRVVKFTGFDGFKRWRVAGDVAERDEDDEEELEPETNDAGELEDEEDEVRHSTSNGKSERMTMVEAAALLGVGTDRVKQLASERRWGKERDGRMVTLARADVEQLKRERAVGGGEDDEPAPKPKRPAKPKQRHTPPRSGSGRRSYRRRQVARAAPLRLRRARAVHRRRGQG